MGIPHLITYLRPYAASTDLSGRSVVIDGPGLAYHVWYICLSFKPQAKNPFEATVSYKLLGDTVIRWLDELQTHGVLLEKIFFDGRLPHSKRPVRISRITRYTKQLNNYHQAWPRIIPKADIDLDSQLSDMNLFNIEAHSSNSTRFPAAPFLVPAIIEALSRCERYAGLFEVVPGEADLYCADYIRIHNGIVLTGDSDLLIHELGDGAVSFFTNIELSSSAKKKSLTCILYKINDIVRRLGLSNAHGLLALAFEMTIDTHASFRELVQRAVKLSAASLDEENYKNFCHEYKSLQPTKTLQDLFNKPYLAEHSRIAHQMKMLDPRVSEYLLQFSWFTRAAKLPDTIQYQSDCLISRGQIDVFLPFLLDCPLYTSAWEMSTSVRQLAYGLVNIALPLENEICKVTEYRRLQGGSQGKEWEVPTANNLLHTCTDLHEQLERIQNAVFSMPKNNLWQAVALFQDQQLYLDTGKPGLSNTLIGGPKGKKSVPPRLTWEIIHLSAQFQGSYYSFRILKQILSVILAYGSFIALPTILSLLYADLESLPTLSEFPTARDVMQSIINPEDQKTLETIKALLGIPLSDVVTPLPTKRKGKRRGASDTAKAVKSQDEMKIQRKEVKNVFELISTG